MGALLGLIVGRSPLGQAVTDDVAARLGVLATRVPEIVSLAQSAFAVVAATFSGLSPLSLTIALTLLAVTGTAFLSGMFGSAGGSLLLGLLLLITDVASAMIIHATVLLTSNFWRSIIWHQHTHWPIFLKYMAGALIGVALFVPFAFLPDKATVYLLLGSVTLLARGVPEWMAPSITRPGAPISCGLVISSIQLLAGSGGGTLDACFQRTSLDRRTVVATKSTIQLAMTVIRIGYFGALAFGSFALPLWTLPVAAAVAAASVSAASLVVLRMSNEGFRRWTGKLLAVIGVSFIGRGLWIALAD